MLTIKYSRRSDNYVWPGFVDALASLLIVIIFILMIFVIAQFYVSKKLSGKDEALIKMEAEIFELNNLLSIERNVVNKLSIDLENLEMKTKKLDFDLMEQKKLYKKVKDNIDLKNFQIVKLNNIINEKDLNLAKIEKKIINLTKLNKSQKITIQDQEEDIKASVSEIKILLSATENLKQKLTEIKKLLAIYEEKDKKEKIKNLNLGKNINNALARRVEELSKFKSEFFGRVKEKIKNRPEIKIVGDRFIFQSEVLFETGSIEIGEKGKKELKRLAAILIDIEKSIPKDINWILQIEGHTDNLPVKPGQKYIDNWELSAERALSVLRFFVKNGLNPNRLSASGYGSYQPVIKESDNLSRAKNRRIEMKITQKLGLID